MKKLEYEAHLEKVKENVFELQTIYKQLKFHFREIDLLMSVIQEKMEELDGSDFSLEIIPLKEKESKFKKWIKHLMNNIKQLKKQ